MPDAGGILRGQGWFAGVFASADQRQTCPAAIEVCVALIAAIHRASERHCSVNVDQPFAACRDCTFVMHVSLALASKTQARKG